MGFKQIFIKKSESSLKQFSFELEYLKGVVEKKGLGDDPEWIKMLHSLREKEDVIRFHLRYIREKKNPVIIKIAKIHAILLLKELGDDVLRITREYNRK